MEKELFCRVSYDPQLNWKSWKSLGHMDFDQGFLKPAKTGEGSNSHDYAVGVVDRRPGHMNF